MLHAEPEDRFALAQLWKQCMLALVDDPREVTVCLYISHDDPTRTIYQLFVDIPGNTKLHAARLAALDQFARQTMNCGKDIEIEVIEKPGKQPLMWNRITITTTGAFKNDALPQVTAPL
jgi:hypothetical protein